MAGYIMTHKVPTVYMVTNLINGKVYVGKHMAPEHDPIDVSYLGSGIGIRRAVDKHGAHNFKKELIAICDTEDQAYELEAQIVTDEFVARPDTYNGVSGGVGLTSEFVKQDLKRRYSCKEYRERHAEIMRNISSRPDVAAKRNTAMAALRLDPAYQAKMAEAYKCPERSRKLSEAAKERHRLNPTMAKEIAAKRSKNESWRANVAASNRRQAMDPAWKESHAKGQAEKSKKPGWKEAISRAAASRSNNEQWREAVRAAGAARAQNPEFKDMMTERNKAMAADPKWLEALRLSHSDPEYRAKTSERVKAQWADPEYKAARLAKMQEKRSSPEFAKKHREAASSANSKAVLAHGKRYNRMQDAAADLGISMYKLRQLLQTSSADVRFVD